MAHVGKYIGIVILGNILFFTFALGGGFNQTSTDPNQAGTVWLMQYKNRVTYTHGVEFNISTMLQIELDHGISGNHSEISSWNNASLAWRSDYSITLFSLDFENKDGSVNYSLVISQSLRTSSNVFYSNLGNVQSSLMLRTHFIEISFLNGQNPIKTYSDIILNTSMSGTGDMYLNFTSPVKANSIRLSLNASFISKTTGKVYHDFALEFENNKIINVIPFNEQILPNVNIPDLLPKIHFPLQIFISIQFISLFLLFRFFRFYGLGNVHRSHDLIDNAKEMVTETVEKGIYAKKTRDLATSAKKVTYDYIESEEVEYDPILVKSAYSPSIKETIVVAVFFIFLEWRAYFSFLSYHFGISSLSSFDIFFIGLFPSYSDSTTDPSMTFYMALYFLIIPFITYLILLLVRVSWDLVTKLLTKSIYYLYLDKEIPIIQIIAIILGTAIMIICLVYAGLASTIISRITLVIIGFFWFPIVVGTSLGAYYFNDIVYNTKSTLTKGPFKNSLIQSIFGISLFTIIVFQILMSILASITLAAIIFNINHPILQDYLLIAALSFKIKSTLLNFIVPSSFLFLIQILSSFFSVLAFYVSEIASPKYYSLALEKKAFYKTLLRVMVFGVVLQILSSILLADTWLALIKYSFDLQPNSVSTLPPQTYISILEPMHVKIAVFFMFVAQGVGYALGTVRSAPYVLGSIE